MKVKVRALAELFKEIHVQECEPRKAFIVAISPAHTNSLVL